VSKFERGLNRAVMGMIISASIIAGSLLLNSPIKVMEVSLVGFTVSLTALLGVAGYCIATLLGLWLIFSIIRSGKM
jgi:ubiquinone biosynthesis protein